MDLTKKFFDQAFNDAFEAVRNNIGGPFGAVIVKDGRIIGRGVNQVTSQNDPTAHAEVMAIRDACRQIDHYDLDGAVIYTTCEPCPMCLSAIYWANIQTVYYCSSRRDAEAIGFRDNRIYEELNLPPDLRSVRFQKLENPRAESLFRSWVNKSDKTPY